MSNSEQRILEKWETAMSKCNKNKIDPSISVPSALLGIIVTEVERLEEMIDQQALKKEPIEASDLIPIKSRDDYPNLPKLRGNNN